MSINKQWIILHIWFVSMHIYVSNNSALCPDDKNYFDCGKQENQEGHQCIPRDQKCNGISECSNGADESVANCGCPGEFQCDNTTCISNHLRCNLNNDCEGGQDEENCETYECPSSYWKCDNHFCIPHLLRCNFHDDCGDNSDEQSCHPRPCLFGEWQCANGACIGEFYLCDDVADCTDGSDELGCSGPSGHLQCANGLYVANTSVCDGWVDCKYSMTDELNCDSCAESQSRCANSRCIEKGNFCDGVCDCEPECDDEKNCKGPICSKEKFICQSHDKYGQYRCLGPSTVCDGINHCKITNYDEEHCGNETEPAPSQCRGIQEDRIGLCTWCVNMAQESCPNPIKYICDNFTNCSISTDQCGSEEFSCGNGSCLPLKHRCDAVHDCDDLLDELDCENMTCGEHQNRCDNGQCVSTEKWCDFFKDCIDNSDELYCDPPDCKDGEFRCASGQCIPKNNTCYYLGPEDRHLGCVDNSHLLNCSNFECAPGYMKCRNSSCVPNSFKCNGIPDCPDSTDEGGCDFICPYPINTCRCKDKAMFCENMGLTSIISTEFEEGLTIYHIGGNYIGKTLGKNSLLDEHAKVTILNLTNNSIHALIPGTFRAMFRLESLILSDNSITHLVNGTFDGLMALKKLELQGNGVREIEPGAFLGLPSVKHLNLSCQNIWRLQRNTFIGLKALLTLRLDHNSMKYIENGAFNDLNQLIKLDLSHNQPDLIIQEYVFNGLLKLEELYTDQFRFCCLARTVEKCEPEPDEFSSCEDLMSNIFLRISIWVLGILSLVGNAVVIVWRIYDTRDSKIHSFLISHLAVADMLMGVYLVIIAAVDSYYRGTYIAYDISWRTSHLCSFAGFLSTFSSELSVFTLTVITLDRFVTIIFPFQFHRLEMSGARLVMAAMWGLSGFVSVIPLCGIPYFMDFYSRSGVCLALHITDDRPNGWEYSVFVFLVLNLISFVVIFIAYVWMFVIANKTRSAVRRDEVQSRSDMAMARRMTLIVSTDFCCWVPIILLGFSSLGGAKIPPQVFAWVAVFVLPFNSAINPILYTISTTTFLKQARMRASMFRKSVMGSLVPVPETRITLASDERMSLQEKTPKIYNRIANFDDIELHGYNRKSNSISNNDYKHS